MKDIDQTIQEQLTENDIIAINIKFRIFNKVGNCSLKGLSKLAIYKLCSKINDNGDIYRMIDDRLYKIKLEG